MKKCWANSIGHCGDKITGEHIISKSILKKTIIVQGFKWCKDEPKEIGNASLVNNFLCNYHNEYLSPYDIEIANFVTSIENFVKTEKRFTAYGFSRKNVPVVHKVNGTRLEKWFIKTLINISLTNEEEAIIHFDKVLPILFSDKPFEKPFGLNFSVRVGQALYVKDEIKIIPLFNKKDNGKELAGGLFTFRGFKIIILIPCSKFPIQDNQLALSNENDDFTGLQLNWHNKEISMDMKRGRKSVKVQSIIFDWET